MMLLAGCIFCSPRGHGVPIDRALVQRITGAHCLPYRRPCVDWHLLARATRAATLAQFTPWRARPKIVLGETNHKLVDESDLGPVLVPSRLIFSRRRLPSSSHLPIFSASLLIISDLPCRAGHCSVPTRLGSTCASTSAIPTIGSAPPASSPAVLAASHGLRDICRWACAISSTMSRNRLRHEPRPFKRVGDERLLRFVVP